MHKIDFSVGGKKFICQGIIFKFALDTEYPPGSNYWVYGGSAPNHEKAMKAACNELKGTAIHPHAILVDAYDFFQVFQVPFNVVLLVSVFP